MDRSPLDMPELFPEQTGTGALWHLQLFPGIKLSQTRLYSEHILLEHEAFSHIVEINHCHRGRIGWDMEGGTSVYLGPGDLDIHMMDCCASSSISLPLGYYEGITIVLDLEQLEQNPLPFIQEVGIRIPGLFHKLCSRKKPMALTAAPEIDHIFDPLYSASERLLLSYSRLKILELLLFLADLAPEQENQLGQYHSKQVETIKEIRNLLTGDLRRRYTIEELSRKYLINTATLKSVFKAVYSQPIGSYMKEYRLHYAMELLRRGDRSIGEIADQVGYESQGNFSEAFKTMTGLSPTEYRRRYRNDIL